MASWAETLEELVQRRGAALVAYGYLLAGNSRDAEDLFHDAVVKTFSRGKASVSIGEAEAYVRRAMFSAHMDAGRKNQAWKRIFHLLRDETGDAPASPPSSSAPTCRRRCATSPRASGRARCSATTTI